MAASVKLSDIIHEYLDLRKDNTRAGTYKADSQYLTRMLAHVGNIQVRHLQSRHILDWLAAPPPLGVGGQAPGTYNQALVRVRAFDRYCQEQGYLSKPVLSRVVKVKPDPPKQRVRYTAGQLLELIDAADHPRDRIFLALLCNTALRCSEATSIRWADVDEDAGWIAVGITKTDKTDRRPITEDLAVEIRRWKRYLTEQNGMPRDDWFFVCKKNPFRWLPGASGKLEITPERGRLVPTERLNQPERVVQRSLARMGLPVRQEGGHTIRRSVALIYFEQLVADGFDDALLTVSALLNHSNTVITQRYLGLDRHVKKRDTSLRGEKFLTKGQIEASITSLRPAAEPAAAPSGSL
jgi:integrase